MDSRAFPPLDVEALKVAIAASSLSGRIKIVGLITDTDRLKDSFKLCFLNELINADLTILKSIFMKAYGRMDSSEWR